MSLPKIASAHDLRVSMKMFHNKVGEDKLTTLEGTGDDARAQISFSLHGVKQLR